MNGERGWVGGDMWWGCRVRRVGVVGLRGCGVAGFLLGPWWGVDRLLGLLGEGMVCLFSSCSYVHGWVCDRRVWWIL